MTMNQYGEVADKARLEIAVTALQENGMKAIIVETAAAARQTVLDLIPEQARVMNMTSVTLDKIGLTQDILESGRFQSVRKDLATAEGAKKRELGAAPDWTVGSVHAVTELGQVVIASNTGSQLPAYAYGAENVIWVVGGQKLVPNLDEAFSRIQEYVLPLEDERAQQAYGMGSNVSKLLVINKEAAPGRITIILVQEKLGF